MNLSDRARAYGIQPDYEVVGGTIRTPPPETLEKLLRAFGADQLAPPASEPRLEAPEGAQCFLPGEHRHWGIALQLYQLRSARNWGIGDFADLEHLARVAAPAGADFLGLNPLHALFLADPARCSPFSPSNRRFLNPLYLAIDHVPGFTPDMADEATLDGLRQTPLVDYPGVAAAKLSTLRAIWAQGAQLPDDFVQEGGKALHRHALFEALSAEMVARGHGAGWLAWPEEWRDAEGPAVQDFAQTHEDQIRFHLWLQYLCAQQLQALRRLCDDLGMQIGLYLDFAVGEAADGSGSWGSRNVLPDVRIGAPPDYFNEQGQDWGLAPLSPLAMASEHAAPFRSLIGAATRQAGALRIDHAMGLWQLFLMPEGASAAEGTYARYPLGDMLTALAEASRRNRTVIIGEDLGNVPPGFQAVMAACNILSYRIFFFERTEAGFIPPADYPRNALACLSTHDLPTFRGWWRGDDIALRRRFGFISDTAALEQETSRRSERADLLADLRAAGLLSAADAKQATPGDAPPALITAVHAHLSRAPSRLFAVRLEDLAAELNPVNVPSTVDDYPNWRHKLGLSLDALTATPLFHDIITAVSAARPGARA
ncbi:4-alpha-glucanotransferase [Pararhodobacter sp.]|uniref:4-alpha-glucanotransferase n=1 Tax=Pararhodobacter sp. TaxID=2127056 RepID=UPI002FDDA47D